MKQEKNDINMTQQVQRLKWACRRGMLELDVLLGDFLEKGYPDLSDEDKQLFISLLNCTDPEIFSWLMGKSIPADLGLKRIVEIMRHHAAY